MQQLTLPQIQSMTPQALDRVYALEQYTRTLPQEWIETRHVIHAGVYARTIEIKAGVLLTGVFIKIPTTLIVSGDVTVYTGGEAKRISGYHVLAAAAGRKQVFLAHLDTQLTMVFATGETDLDRIEAQFTDEVELLMSHGMGNTVVKGD